jgi:hypothetical protein
MNAKSLIRALILFGTFYIPVSGYAYFSLSTSDTAKYYNGQDFTITGKFHTEPNYVRFPQKYKNTVRPEVWDLSQNSAGISIRFRSNATGIRIRWTVMDEVSLPHMASTGVRGVDLYANVNGNWQFIQTGRPSAKTSEYVMLEKGEPVFREYLLNLPLYDGIESLFIGINTDAVISKPKEHFLPDNKPVVYYGSSIAQGGCASRPGMAFTNILSRKLNRSFINLGFSGEGTFDASVGEAMCEMDAALYVIDCNPNTEEQFIYERAVKLVQQLKKCRPEVPVLLVENFLFDKSYFMPDKLLHETAKRTELKRAFEFLKKSGVTNLYYQTGEGLTGSDHEATVDGVHPTDLGMYRIAEFLLPQIDKIIGNK